MKKISAILLCFLIALCSTACGGNKTVSSEASPNTESTTSADSGGLGLFDNVSVLSSEESKEAESSKVNKNETTSSENTESEEVESQETESQETESETTSSTDEKKDSNTDTDTAVKPSTIPNPTGIESTGRKDNKGKGWELTLVNPWNTLDKNYSVDLKLLDSRFGDGKYFDARAVEYLEAMCEAAAEDGVNLWVISAHRTYDYQQMLFDAEKAEYKSYNPNCSDSEAEIGAASVVARPGTSEHNLGLAVDFNSVEQSFENTAQYKWLRKHCTEYGFIMRYSAETQNETGVIYEPWHYRYVGVDNAKKIANSGLSLEAYLAKQ